MVMFDLQLEQFNKIKPILLRQMQQKLPGKL
jgi:hypothetical protein